MKAAGKSWAQNLAATMKKLRKLRGIGLREYAKELGVNTCTLNRIELGRGCDLNGLVAIRESTGISYEALLGNAAETPEQRAARIDAASLADAHRMYEKEHGLPFSEVLTKEC